MIKAEVIGNLGADAQKNQGNDGFFVTFRVAHSQKYTDRQTGEVINHTTWISCTLNGDGGNLLPYLRAGEKVYVRGNLTTRIYVGQDGQKHAGVNISVQEIELVSMRAKYTAQDVADRIANDPQFAQEFKNVNQPF